MSRTPWHSIVLGDTEAASIDRGVSWSKADESASPNGVPVLSIPNIRTGQIDFDCKVRLSKEATKNKLLSAGDILLVGSSGAVKNVGRAALVEETPRQSIAFASFVVRVKPGPAFDPRFLAACLESSLVDFNFHSKKAADGKFNLQLGSLREQVLPLPPLEEQGRIADLLSLAIRALRSEEQWLAIGRQLKKAALQAHFSEDTPEAETRSLEALATARGGSPFPHRYQGHTSGDLPFYKVSDMNSPGNEIAMDRPAHWVSRAVAEELGAKPFSSETVIFPKVGGAIFTNKKRLLSRPAIVDNNVMGVTVRDSETLLPRFLFQWFQTIALASLSNPGPLPSISARRLYELRVPLPSITRQMEVVGDLEAIDRAVGVHEQRSAVMQASYRALLEGLLSGSLRADMLDGRAKESITA